MPSTTAAYVFVDRVQVAHSVLAAVRTERQREHNLQHPRERGGQKGPSGNKHWPMCRNTVRECARAPLVRRSGATCAQCSHPGPHLWQTPAMLDGGGKRGEIREQGGRRRRQLGTRREEGCQQGRQKKAERADGRHMRGGRAERWRRWRGTGGVQNFCRNQKHHLRGHQSQIRPAEPRADLGVKPLAGPRPAYINPSVLRPPHTHDKHRRLRRRPCEDNAPPTTEGAPRQSKVHESVAPPATPFTSKCTNTGWPWPTQVHHRRLVPCPLKAKRDKVRTSARRTLCDPTCRPPRPTRYVLGKLPQRAEMLDAAHGQASGHTIKAGRTTQSRWSLVAYSQMAT